MYKVIHIFMNDFKMFTYYQKTILLQFLTTHRCSLQQTIHKLTIFGKLTKSVSFSPIKSVNNTLTTNEYVYCTKLYNFSVSISL